MAGKRAVVLLSGGIDSATAAAMARQQGFEIHALSFRYGQRHECELAAAQKVAAFLGAASHRVMEFDMRVIGGSALTDRIDVPKGRSSDEIAHGIPITYVPARNTIFLSFGLALAERIEAEDIFFGANQLDYSGYPDCREEYIQAFERMANFATTGRRRGPQPHQNKRSFDSHDQSRDRQTRTGAGPRLRAHLELLRSGPGWPCLRAAATVANSG